MAFWGKNKKWLGYGLYIVLITLALLYFLFPSQAVEEFVGTSITRINPEFDFKAEKIRPWLPPGVHLKDGRIYHESTPEPAVFLAESLFFRPRVLKMVKGEYSVDLSGEAYGGKMKGVFHTKDETGKNFAGELSFNHFDLAAYGFLTEKLKHRITGKFSGDIVYEKDAANPGGTGNAELRLTAGQLQFQAPIFGIRAVDMQNVDVEFDLRDSDITIIKAELNGSEVKATITGSIQLQPDIKGSQLDLRGTLEPLAEFYKNHPEIRELLKSMRKRVKRGQYFFAITGTLGQPKFRLL